MEISSQRDQFIAHVIHLFIQIVSHGLKRSVAEAYRRQYEDDLRNEAGDEERKHKAIVFVHRYASDCAGYDHEARGPQQVGVAVSELEDQHRNLPVHSYDVGEGGHDGHGDRRLAGT